MAFQKFTLNGGLILIAIILFFTAGNTENNSADYISQDYVIPFHYNVEIRCFEDDNILFGLCNILISIAHSFSSIMLYSASIRVIDAVLLNDENNIAYKLNTSSWNQNILTLYFDNKQYLHPAIYSLKITYMRNVHEIKDNFFRYAYLKEFQVEELKLIKTNIKIMKARQLFPCRDELTTKSTFKIAIKHHEKYTVLSNMYIQAKYKNDSSMMWTVFEKSIIMSAQNIAVVITTFTNQTFTQDRNITIWCKPRVLENNTYPIFIFQKIVPHFKQKYFMELPKLDIIILSQDDMQPQDDNFITFGILVQKESDLIYNEEYYPLIRKKNIAHMIARQFAFVWCFDVLLWSKEGFATFFGAYILNEIFQDDYMMDLLVVQAQHNSFHYDNPSTIDSREKLLEYPSNYLKSFIIWRMLYHAFPDVFWIGIHTYVDQQRQIISSQLDMPDLWTVMQTIYNNLHPKSKLSLKIIINNWITKKYYPVLNVTLKYEELKFMIKYLPSPSVFGDNQTETWIPITYTTKLFLNYDNASDINVCSDCMFWMNKHTYSQIFNTYDWIILNIQQTGYYRVKYNFENWDKLMRYLNSEDYNKIHILNRAQMIDDAFYFLLQKQFNYRDFWNLTNFIASRETNFTVWYPVFKAFEFLSCKVPFDHDSNIVEKMKIAIKELFTNIVRTPSQTDHSLTRYLKEEAVKWECILGFTTCRKWAFFQLWEDFRHPVNNTNIFGKEVIYCYGVKEMKSFSSDLLSRFKITSDIRFLEYLTCIEDDYVICDYLSQVIHYDIHLENSTRATEILRTVAKHAKRDQVLSSFFANFTKVTLSSNKKNNIIATLIVIITHVHSPDQMDKIYNFAMGYPTADIPQYIINAIKEKLKQRRLEYAKLVHNYGLLAGTHL